MSNGPTGSMIIANLGLLKNSGLEISPALKQTVNVFNTTGISGSVQRIIPTASVAIKDILKSAPVCLTGFLPAGIASMPGIVETNIPQSVLNQANSLFTAPSGNSSVAAFIHICTVATAYSSQASSMQNSIVSARGKAFNELGAQFNNYSDVITGGISNQFKVSAVPALAAELPNLGTMFNTTTLSKISDLGVLVTHLYSLGLGDIGNLRSMVESNEITLDFIDETEQNLLLNIFKKITGNDLSSIMQATSFKPARLNDINTLADILDINKLLSNAALEALGTNPTLDSLSNKLSNIGGKFSSMADIGKFMAGLNLTTFPAMQSLTSILPDDLAEELNAITNKGAGSTGTTVITDLVGSVSGTNYTDRIASVISTQNQLLAASQDVRDFKNYLDQWSDSNQTKNITELQLLISRITSNPSLIESLANANQHIIICAKQLEIEKQNLQLANAIPGSAESVIADIQIFVNNLGKLSSNSDTLKLGNFLSSIATNNVYGEAVKAAIVEGQNLSRMAAYGINVNTNLS